jgi:hypothetical protein
MHAHVCMVIGALFRRVAIDVDKTLKGAKPAEPSVEQPKKLEPVPTSRQGHRPRDPSDAALPSGRGDSVSLSRWRGRKAGQLGSLHRRGVQHRSFPPQMTKTRPPDRLPAKIRVNTGWISRPPCTRGSCRHSAGLFPCSCTWDLTGYPSQLCTGPQGAHTDAPLQGVQSDRCRGGSVCPP